MNVLTGLETAEQLATSGFAIIQPNESLAGYLQELEVVDVDLLARPFVFELDQSLSDGEGIAVATELKVMFLDYLKVEWALEEAFHQFLNQVDLTESFFDRYWMLTVVCGYSGSVAELQRAVRHRRI